MLNLLVKSKNREDIYRLQRDIHEALCGSPGYINNEILLSDVRPMEGNEETLKFHLLVGHDNGDDMTLVVDSESILLREKFDNRENQKPLAQYMKAYAEGVKDPHPAIAQYHGIVLPEDTPTQE